MLERSVVAEINSWVFRMIERSRGEDLKGVGSAGQCAPPDDPKTGTALTYFSSASSRARAASVSAVMVSMESSKVDSDHFLTYSHICRRAHHMVERKQNFAKVRTQSAGDNDDDDDQANICQLQSDRRVVGEKTQRMHFNIMSSSIEAGPSTQPTAAGPLRTTKETHPNLPPGLILGPDGKPCKVCNSWQDWAKMKVKKKDGSNVAGGMGGFAAMMGGATSTTTARPKRTELIVDPASVGRKDCPADTEALGRSTWTFLHTTAAYYPVVAPARTQTQMRNLLSSLSILYPCVPCAEDFQDKVKEHPPDVSGREALSRWLCERHNEVNEKLGKESFSCDWRSLNGRWKDGPDDGSCD